MIRAALLVISAAVLVFGATGCVSTMTPATNTTDIHSVDFSSTFKKGMDCATYVLLFGPFGDASIVNAAKSAGIAKVEIVDYQRKWYPFVNKHCVVVYGN